MRNKKNSRSVRKRHLSRQPKKAPAVILPEITENDSKNIELFSLIILLCFGIYHSFLFYGYKIIPNPDFSGFVRVGRELWSLQLPATYIRMPMVGMLQVALGFIVGGQHPDLTGGWLLNAILHPCNIVLLWLVGRHVIGRSAFWFALIASINPQVIYMVIEPIAETSLLFFSLLSFYLIIKRSKWAYVAAAAASMVRYEGAALIFCAFLMDMIYCDTKKERIRAFVFSVAASIPMLLWLVAGAVDMQEGGFHYFSVFSKKHSKGFSESVSDRTGFLLHLRLIWETGFRPLLAPAPKASPELLSSLWGLSKLIASIGFVLGVVFGIVRRQWFVLVMLGLLVPYYILHAVYPYPFHRFYSNVSWIVLLVCWYGLQNLWISINEKTQIPKPVIWGVQGLGILFIICWMGALIPGLSNMSSVSPRSVWLPWVGLFVLILFTGISFYCMGPKKAAKDFVIIFLVWLFVISNQFFLVSTIGNGKREQEFKLLADWYVDNAEGDEKMALYMSSVVAIFAPKHKENIVKPPNAENANDFVQACYKNNITYVVWATREGLRNNEFYRLSNLYQNMGMLREPKNIGPYEFVTQIRNGKEYLNVFQLRKPSGYEQK